MNGKYNVSEQKKQDNYIIRIKSSIEQDGEPQSIELTTRGQYHLRNGCYYISYKETKDMGYEGCSVTVKVAEDASRVAMLRFGKANTQLLIEKGRRNVCHYETGYGSLTLGVSADVIESQLTETGGSVHFSYILDADSAGLISKSCLDISVTHIN